MAAAHDLVGLPSPDQRRIVFRLNKKREEPKEMQKEIKTIDTSQPSEQL